ncbi:MAG: GMC oxidoreductase [Actinomycetota bacterium]|nr:GMC oxidoreductase [Actinomycetota bacterium]
MIEGRSLPEGTTLRAEVCLVGAGPAGLAAAHQLARSGMDVVLLEAGPASPPEGGEEVPSTRNVGIAYDIATSRAGGVGGSSLRWDIETPLGPDHVRLRELDDLDFEARPGVPRSGWPLARAALRSSYRQAWELFGLRPQEEEQAPDPSSPLQPVAFSFGPASTFTTHLPEVLRHHQRATVVSDARVTGIRTDIDPACVSSLTCSTPDGVHFSIEASAYVLAAGGIENARLLLASQSSHREGIGNGHDQVGRCFMEHPHHLAGLLLGRPPGGEPGWGVIRDQDRQAQERAYRLDPEVVRREELLNVVTQIDRRAITQPLVIHRNRSVDEETADALRETATALRAGRLRRPGRAEAARMARAAPGVGHHLLRQVVTRGGRASGVRRFYNVRMMAEQAPDPESRVRLVAARDSAGVQEAELDWRIGPLDERSISRTVDLVGPALERRFDGRFTRLLPDATPPLLGVGWHHMGTTRMSASPAGGVVDVDGRVHGIGNLYVTGSSVFPTGGSANPTLTIVALALRLADHLAARRAHR